MDRIRLAAVSVVIAGLAIASAGCATTAAVPMFTYAPPAAQPAVVQATPVPTASKVAPAATDSPSAAGRPTVSLTEWKVVVAGTIKSGKIDLAISNIGTIPHELLVFKSNRDPSAYPTDAAGNIKEEGAGVDLVSDGDNIDPGGSQARTINLAPGRYLFVCNIPGHFKAGMFAIVTVAP